MQFLKNFINITISMRACACICFLLLGSVTLVGCKDEKAKGREAALSFIHSAEAYHAQGQYRSAIQTAKNAIQKAPDDPRAYKFLAGIYNDLGAYVSTQQLLEAEVQKNPQIIPELAYAYIENKKYRSAIKLLSDYEPEKNDLKARVVKYKLLARAYIYYGDEAEFMSAYAALIGLGGLPEETAQLKAENLLNQGRTLEAYTALDDFVESKNISVKTLLFLAIFAESQQQLTNAENYLLRALAQLPSTDLMTAEKGKVLRMLVDVLSKEGRTADAYVYQKSLSENNPESIAAQEKFNESMALFHKGKLAESEKLLIEIREQFPQEKNAGILLGLVNYQQGDLKQANELFDQYIDLETSTGSVVRVAAMAKFRINQSEEAIELLRRSAEEQPDKAEILAAYGLALLEQDIKSKDAEKYLEKSFTMDSKQSSVGLALAKHYFVLNDQTQAISHLQAAYAAQQTDFVTQLAYFKALAAAGKLEQVRQEIAEFKKNNPDLSRNQFLDGWYKFTTKDFSGAQTIFERALNNKNNLDRLETYRALAETYLQQNQKAKAADVFKDVLRNFPEQVSVYAEWLQLEQSLNRSKDVISFLLSLESRTQTWQPSVVLAQVYVAQSQLPEAIKHIEVALQRNHNVDSVRKIAANLYYQYGLQLLTSNQLIDAKARILKALDYAPNNMNYLAGLVQIEINSGHLDEAQKVLDHFSVSPDVQAERAYLQSLIRVKENKPEEALKYLKESWLKKPLPVVADALYKSYEESHESKLSEGFVDDWLKKLPNSIRPHLIKGLSEQNKGNYSNAALLYEKCLTLDAGNLMALNNLAWVYHEMKDPKALSFGERAYQVDPNNSAVIDTYATILWDANRNDEAYSLFQKAALLEPKNLEIQKHLLAAKKKLRK